MITVNRLHEFLGKLIKDGHGRKPIAVNKISFSHPLESDGAVILDVRSMRLQFVPTMDDDGGTKENKDGSESGKYMIVLSGDAAIAKGE